MKIEEKINLLRNQLKKWEYEYYALENPSVSDIVYDSTLKELIELENKYPEYKSNESPTVRVGGVISDKFEKIIHKVPMLSLSNAFNLNDLIKFDNDIKKLLNEKIKFTYSIEPKIDGLSISLLYKNGYLFRAITRGDGIEGENVTNNIRTIRYIPLSIDFKEDIELRGEIFFNKSTFIELNNSLSKPFANARNAASGSIRNLDSSITSQRKLNAIIYNIPEALKYKIFKQSDALEWIKKNKFNISKNNYVANSINEVIDRVKWFEKNKDNFPYDIDGVVIKINEINLYDEIGYTSKFPKWSIAYKFPPNVCISKLNNIFTSVGRTGRINYIGNIEKINIDGSFVQNATLHNYEYIKSKDIKINDYVEIYKAGEIIPKIIGPIIQKRNGEEIIFNEPKICPSCKKKIFKIIGEIDLYCLNDQCEGRIIESIVHFTSRQAMDIQGLSKKNIEKLFQKKIIENVIDIYNIENKKNEIINLDLQIKDKTINNLIVQINASKNKSLEKLIFGLGIKHIGEVASKAIAKKYKTLNNLKNVTIESLLMINDLGEKMAKSIFDYFNNEENKKIIDKFIELKIANQYFTKWSNNQIIDENLKYKNKKIVITGSFSESRNIIKNILEDLYEIKVSSKITSAVDFLLVGNNPTEKKINEAKKNNIEIINFEFWKN